LTDEAILEALPSLDPLRIREAMTGRDFVRGRTAKTLVSRLPFLAPLLDGSSLPAIEVEVRPKHGSELSFLLKAFQGEGVAAAYDAPEGPGWHLFETVATFVRSPSSDAAARFLEDLRQPDNARLASFMALPWPLSTMQALVEDGRSLEAVIASARAGDFGDVEDWKLAERRLEESGMSADDLLLWADGVVIDRSVAKRGMPYPATMTLTRGRDTDPVWLLALRHAASIAPEGVALDLMRRALAFALTSYRMSTPVDVTEWLRLFVARPRNRLLDPRLLSILPTGHLRSNEMEQALSTLGERGDVMVGDSPEVMIERLPELLGAHPGEGLMAVALATMARSRLGVLKVASLSASELDVQARTVAGRDAVAALRVAAGLPTDPAALTDPNNLDSVGQYAVLSLMQELDEASVELEEVVSYLATVPSGAELSRGQALEVLKRSLDRRRATIALPETWDAVGLPSTLSSQLAAGMLHAPAAS